MQNTAFQWYNRTSWHWNAQLHQEFGVCFNSKNLWRTCVQHSQHYTFAIGTHYASKSIVTTPRGNDESSYLSTSPVMAKTYFYGRNRRDSILISVDFIGPLALKYSSNITRCTRTPYSKIKSTPNHWDSQVSNLLWCYSLLSVPLDPSFQKKTLLLPSSQCYWQLSPSKRHFTMEWSIASQHRLIQALHQTRHSL